MEVWSGYFCIIYRYYAFVHAFWAYGIQLGLDSVIAFINYYSSYILMHVSYDFIFPYYLFILSCYFVIANEAWSAYDAY